MFERRQPRVLPQSRWNVAVAVLLLLIVLLAVTGSHSPVGICCLVLIPVFLFALVEVPAEASADEPLLCHGFDDGSPSLFERPPPSLS